MRLKNFWIAIVGLLSASIAQSVIAGVTFDETLAPPESFGYKVNWFTVKTQDPKLVAKALGLTELRKANWASGLAAAYSFDTKPNSPNYVFISPQVGGWVMVVGKALPYPDKRAQGLGSDIDKHFQRLFHTLAKAFVEVQFFGSYRVVGFEAWARARGGKIERVFSFADGEVYENLGNQTSIEKQLGLPNLSAMSPERATSEIFTLAEKIYKEEERLVASGLTFKQAREKLRASLRTPIPSEGDAIAIAAHWSIDPTRIEEMNLAPSIGYVAVLPNPP